jgi:hypothetical protein
VVLWLAELVVLPNDYWSPTGLVALGLAELIALPNDY